MQNANANRFNVVFYVDHDGKRKMEVITREQWLRMNS
jgi:hypothetical protein